MNHISRISMVSLAVLILASVAFGQAPRAYHPGQTITIEITFEGVDAHQVETAMAFLNLPATDRHAGQTEFQTELQFSGATKSSPNTITVSHKVAPNEASGTYKLTQVRLGTGGDSPVWAFYQSGLPEFEITIENRERFVQPKIKGVKDVSHP